MEKQNKQMQIVLLCSIVVSVTVIFFIYIYNKIFKKFDNQLLDIENYFENVQKNVEKFYNKRETRMKIYKSDEINDPHKNPKIDNNNDPDSNPIKFDPN